MKPTVECTGCATRLGRNDSAIHVTHTDDAGVTTKWSLCEPCLIRFHRDEAFAERFETIASLLKGSIEA